MAGLRRWRADIGSADQEDAGNQNADIDYGDHMRQPAPKVGVMKCVHNVPLDSMLAAAELAELLTARRARPEFERRALFTHRRDNGIRAEWEG